MSHLFPLNAKHGLDGVLELYVPLWPSAHLPELEEADRETFEAQGAVQVEIEVNGEPEQVRIIQAGLPAKFVVSEEPIFSAHAGAHGTHRASPIQPLDSAPRARCDCGEVLTVNPITGAVL